jgi:MYXO-CTERM domain-containing protein
MPVPPSAMDSERHYTLAEGAPGRRGGCAGCTSARSETRSGLEALAASLLALTFLVIRRRNQGNLDRPTP